MKSTERTSVVLTLLFLVMVLAVVSAVYGAEEKRMMIAFTGDTQGEINPCG
jgi:hypothetical protein